MNWLRLRLSATLFAVQGRYRSPSLGVRAFAAVNSNVAGGAAAGFPGNRFLVRNRGVTSTTSNLPRARHNSNKNNITPSMSTATGGERGGDVRGSKSEVNRLAGETSPYLLQHARNPVDWMPWGEEAFRRAKAEDKPIFLSVGYSTCHW